MTDASSSAAATVGRQPESETSSSVLQDTQVGVFIVSAPYRPLPPTVATDLGVPRLRRGLRLLTHSFSGPASSITKENARTVARKRLAQATTVDVYRLPFFSGAKFVKYSCETGRGETLGDRDIVVALPPPAQETLGVDAVETWLIQAVACVSLQEAEIAPSLMRWCISKYLKQGSARVCDIASCICEVVAHSHVRPAWQVWFLDDYSSLVNVDLPNQLEELCLDGGIAVEEGRYRITESGRTFLTIGADNVTQQHYSAVIEQFVAKQKELAAQFEQALRDYSPSPPPHNSHFL